MNSSISYGSSKLSGRTATYVIAASNAPANVKAQSDVVCDGTADQVEINYAIATLGYRSIALSEGTFTIAAYVVLYPGTHVSGKGKTTIVTGAQGFSVSGADCDVSDMYFSSITGNAVTIFTEGTGSSLENIIVSGCTESGIVSSATDINIINCDSSANTQFGVILNGVRNVVSGGHFSSNVMSAVTVRSSDCQVNGITAYANDKGISVYAVDASHPISSVSISGNILIDNVQRQIQINSDQAPSSFGVVVDGNSCRWTLSTNTTGEAIDVLSFKGTVISNNYVYGNKGTTHGYGIVVDSGSDYSSIVGNVVEWCSHAGIHIFQSDFVTCVGNTIKNCGVLSVGGVVGGIFLDSTSVYNIVGNNEVIDSQASISSLLTGTANSGQKVVSVTDGSKFKALQWVTISDGAPATENNQIDTITGNNLTMKTNLTNTYTVAASGIVTGRTTGTYGIAESAGANYNKISNNVVSGSVTANIVTVGVNTKTEGNIGYIAPGETRTASGSLVPTGTCTATTVTGTFTESPLALKPGANTMTCTASGTINVVMPAGSTAVVTSGDSTVTDSPKTCAAGATTLVTVTTGAGADTFTITVHCNAFAWHNPEAQDILIKKIVINRTAAGGTATAEINVGIADNGTVDDPGTEFFNNLLANNAAAIHDSYVAGGTSYGTQTIWVSCEDSASATGGWVVGKLDTEIANSLAGTYYIEYVGK
jgi:hypothetical protein